MRHFHLMHIVGLFCRIQSLLYGSFAKETYNPIILMYDAYPYDVIQVIWLCCSVSYVVLQSVTRLCCSVSYGCVAVCRTAVLQCAVRLCCSVSVCCTAVLQCAVWLCCSAPYGCVAVFQCVARLCCSVLYGCAAVRCMHIHMTSYKSHDCVACSVSS